MPIHVREHTSHCHYPAGGALCHLNSGKITVAISENHTARHTTEVGLLKVVFQEPVEKQTVITVISLSYVISGWIRRVFFAKPPLILSLPRVFKLA